MTRKQVGYAFNEAQEYFLAYLSRGDASLAENVHSRDDLSGLRMVRGVR